MTDYPTANATATTTVAYPEEGNHPFATVATTTTTATSMEDEDGSMEVIESGQVAVAVTSPYSCTNLNVHQEEEEDDLTSSSPAPPLSSENADMRDNNGNLWKQLSSMSSSMWQNLACHHRGRTLGQWYGRHPFALGSTLLIVIALGCSIALVIRMIGRSDDTGTGTRDNNDSSNDGKDALDEGYYDYLLDLLLQKAPRSSSLLLQTDPTSPPHLALNWLVYQDSLYLREPSQVLQRYALVLLYFATGGVDFWDREWLLPHESECQFEGVTCEMAVNATTTNNTSSPPLVVTKVELDSRTLVGPLPSEVSLLTSLQDLNLRGNRLEGTIPTEWCTGLSSLRFLDLGDNVLVSTIPSEVSQLMELRTLYLDNNFLTGLLPVNLPPYLELFFVMANRLEGPWERMLLSSIATDDVVNAANHSVTHMVTPSPTVAPTTTTSSSSTSTSTTPPPPPPPHLQKIRLIDVGYNSLTGSIPTTIGQLSNLISVSLNSNSRMDGTLPSELGRLTLEKFALGNTRIEGTIPMEIWNAGSALRIFSIFNSPLTGTIPTEIGFWTQLKEFNIMHSKLEGTIPSEIGKLSNSLMKFLVANSNVSGMIPSELGVLTTLQTIWLQYTELEGMVSEEMCHIPAASNDFRANCLDDSPIQCDCCTTCYGF